MTDCALTTRWLIRYSHDHWTTHDERKL